MVGSKPAAAADPNHISQHIPLGGAILLHMHQAIRRKLKENRKGEIIPCQAAGVEHIEDIRTMEQVTAAFKSLED